MTQEHSDWLPFDSLTSSAITSAFDHAISAWSERWFGDRPLELACILPQRGKPSLKTAKAEWRTFGHGVYINWIEEKQLALAEQSLHTSPIQQKQSAIDRSLMLALSQRIIDDLMHAFVNVVGREIEPKPTSAPANPYEVGGGLELQIKSVSEGALITAGISSLALTRLRKKQCNRYVPTKMQNAPVVDILGPVIVDYTAEIGRASMSASELHNMAEGDVVVLDRPLVTPLDILAKSSGRVLFKAMLGKQAEGLALTAVEFEGKEL